MKKDTTLLPPIMPNFIKSEIGNSYNMISVSDLTVKEAEEYGELMKQEFIKHHASKVNQPK